MTSTRDSLPPNPAPTVGVHVDDTVFEPLAEADAVMRAR